MIEMPKIATDIWNMKYRYLPTDPDIQGTWRRVAYALSANEADQPKWRDNFYTALEDFVFLPGGRILAGAGTGRSVTMMNCYVMGTIPDSMDGIFTHLREAALTMQQGGGIGMDFSTLRPKGALVNGVDSEASGPLSFMDCWDAMCRTIMSAGVRRGAMMATMRCDHPDVEDFITVKADPARMRMFNMSVLVTDAFMEAVKNNAKWPLTFEGEEYGGRLARELWDKIMRSTYGQAEPGVIFIDRVNAMNNLHWCEKISATNPCGEIPMGPYSACLLGSINLATLVLDPFTAKARIDTDRLATTVPVAVRMLDNVNDITNYPLPQQKEQALAKRRIGLGVTGLADALVMCGLRYGSQPALSITNHWVSLIEQEAYRASVSLAREKGPFPLFDANEYCKSGYANTLPVGIRDGIAKNGIRNSHLMAIAPTGTISLLAGNVSSGIEPIFACHYTRKVLQADGSHTEEHVEDFAYRLFREHCGGGEDVTRATVAASPEWVTAQELTWKDHVLMQAAVQRHVDQAISKTINLPAETTFEEFKEVYAEAYKRGCKSCTTYRPNDVTGSVLSVDDIVEAATRPVLNKAEPPSVSEDTKKLDYKREEADMLNTSERPFGLSGRTYKVRWPDDKNHAYYITINDRDDKPFEIFINSKSVDSHAWITALMRMISAVFRDARNRGADVDFVVEELRSVFDPRGGAWVSGAFKSSVPAMIADVLESHIRNKEVSIIQAKQEEHDKLEPKNEHKSAMKQYELSSLGLSQCPQCYRYSLVHSDGCEHCSECGYDRCG